MTDPKDLTEIVRVFALYGFRKTSMRDIADGIGISRQALYNRFSSKEVIFDWAVRTLVEESCEQCLAELGRNVALPNRLAMAIHIWVGQYVDMLRASPHSAEIVAMVGDASISDSHNATQQILQGLAEAILKDSENMTKKQAEDLAFVLYYSAKGLLHNSKSSLEHQESMKRVIAALPIA